MKQIIRSAGETEIPDGLKNASEIFRVGCDPDIHGNRVSHVSVSIHGIAADQEKSSAMGIERLQELFEIAWYPGRRH